MSLARIIAMMANQPTATFILTDSGGQGATGFSVPTSGVGGAVEISDFLIVEYYSSITISGGSGAAFATTSFSNTKVSCRAIEAADLTTPFTFDTPGPYILTIIRGPRSMGAAVRSGSLSGSTVYATAIAGITPTPGALAVMGFANSDGSGQTEVYYHTTDDVLIPGPFNVTNTQLTSGLGYAMGVLINLSGYSGAPFSINTEAAANALTYRIHELF